MSSDRNAYLHEISSFISESKSYLNNLLSELNWTDDKTYQHLKCDDNVCKNHDEDTVINTDFNETTIGVRIDSNENKPVPSDLIDLQQPVKKGEEISLFELLAKERDLKRRRISYKGRVHTKHKSHYEIMRDVIAQQMVLLEDSAGLQTLSDCVDVSKDNHNETELIDLSRLYVQNPHLTWKYVKKEVESKSASKEKRSHEDKYLREERSRHESQSRRTKLEKRSRLSDNEANEVSTKRKRQSICCEEPVRRKSSKLPSDERQFVKKENVSNDENCKDDDSYDVLRSGMFQSCTNDRDSSDKNIKPNSREKKSDSDLDSTDGELVRFRNIRESFDTHKSKKRHDKSEHRHKKKSKKRSRDDVSDEPRSKKHKKRSKSGDRSRRLRHEDT